MSGPYQNESPKKRRKRLWKKFNSVGVEPLKMKLPQGSANISGTGPGSIVYIFNNSDPLRDHYEEPLRSEVEEYISLMAKRDKGINALWWILAILIPFFCLAFL